MPTYIIDKTNFVKKENFEIQYTDLLKSLKGNSSRILICNSLVSFRTNSHTKSEPFFKFIGKFGFDPTTFPNLNSMEEYEYVLLAIKKEAK